MQFQETVFDYYDQHKRTLPWRTPPFDAYHIMVSEVMLQQTQVPRVIEKYRQFLALFPNITSLANASLSDVLAAWSGLGYNRRARFLREAAQTIVKNHDGIMPSTVAEYVTLPGIGYNTASAICVYAFNQPLVFIETNIRSVYLHHFFEDASDVSDKQILEVVANTLDHENPRNWYWALMDYGTYIKKTHGNPNIRSKQYKKQSRFEGSIRQLRGEILRQLADGPAVITLLEQTLPNERLHDAIDGLVKDGLIQRNKKSIQIAH